MYVCKSRRGISWNLPQLELSSANRQSSFGHIFLLYLLYDKYACYCFLVCAFLLFSARAHKQTHTRTRTHTSTRLKVCVGSKRGSETYFSLLDDTNKTMQRIRQRRQLICFVLRIYCIGHGWGRWAWDDFSEGGLEVGLALCLRPQRAYILFVHSFQQVATILCAEHQFLFTFAKFSIFG